MIKTWILAAWRSFIKNKGFYFLNISGLSLGLSSLIAILLFAIDELAFDRFHQNGDRIYRINVISAFGGQSNKYATTSTPLIPAIQSDIAEVKMAARVFGRQAAIEVINQDSARARNEIFREDNFYFADPEILNVLTFSFLVGNPATALSNPNQVIISKSLSSKYFGSPANALGRLIGFEGTIQLEVSGVFEDFPNQSSYNIDLLAHFDNYFNIEREGIREYLKSDWMYNPVTSFVVLNSSENILQVRDKIQALNEKYADERVRQGVTYQLQPLEDIHLYSDVSFVPDQMAIKKVQTFLIVGMLILIIACINFINLSTVHALKRIREIGVRKVLGASKKLLIYQFMTESFVLVVVAMSLAVLLFELMLPNINMLFERQLTIEALLDPLVFSLLLMVLFATAVMAGLYPAWYIANFNAVKSLKGQSGTVGNGGLTLRRVLVAVQFTASIVLGILAMVISFQMDFIKAAPLGFQKEQMVTIPLFSANLNSILGSGVEAELRGRMNTFESEVVKIAGVESVTVSSGLPGQGAVSALIKTTEISEQDNIFVPVISVDYDFIETFAIELLAGRNFDKGAGTDHLEALLANEQAIKLLGFDNPETALGYPVEVLGKNARIIGIIRDFNFEGLQQNIRPLLLEVNVSKFTTFSLRLTSSPPRNISDQIHKVWKRIFPDKAFALEYLDVQLQQTYEADERFGNQIKAFSILALIISALGLFGLAAYVGYQRKKEAGIRKVLGADTFQVFFALSKEFMIIFVIAMITSLPLGYWLSQNWLDNFAFRIPLGWSPFVITFLLTGAVILISTAYQTYRAATVNVIDTIRSE